MKEIEVDILDFFHYICTIKRGGNMHSVKEQMTKIIQEQPDDYSYDEILRELAFSRMIERGLEDSRANRTISNDEMKQRIKTWRR